MIDYGLYLITDDPSRYQGYWLDSIIAAVEGGVTCVQYRDTESSDAERYGRALSLRDALRPHNVPLIINNDVQLAATLHSDGVHVGQQDLPVPEARRIVGRQCEIGLSITCMADADRLLSAEWRDEVNCVGIGPVYDATKTKVDASAAVGIAETTAIAHRLDGISSCAIGGIDCDNAVEVISTGVGGLAVVSAFSKAQDPYSVARRFQRILRKNK